MQNQSPEFAPDLSGLNNADWLAEMAAIGEDMGFFEPLGKRHWANFIDEGDTLLVTFETMQGLRSLSPKATPLGFDLIRTQGWSHLGVICDGDTWFRTPQVYGFFDRMIDDGFFDEFDRIVFYGAGPCGYAAGAYSVASPGARVLMVQPQATLDPRVTEWDDRFTELRRTNFTDRYGYAPDMLDAADAAYVIYDPREDLDAMHAALFTRANVTKLRMPHMGDALQSDLLALDILEPLLRDIASETGLVETHFHQLARKRRDYSPYLRNLLSHLEREGRDTLTRMLCTNVVGRMNGPRFRRKLEQMQGE